MLQALLFFGAQQGFKLLTWRYVEHLFNSGLGYMPKVLFKQIFDKIIFQLVTQGSAFYYR